MVAMAPGTSISGIKGSRLVAQTLRLSHIDGDQHDDIIKVIFQCFKQFFKFA